MHEFPRAGTSCARGVGALLILFTLAGCADEPAGPATAPMSPRLPAFAGDVVPVTTDLTSTTGVPMASLSGTAAPKWRPEAINASNWVTGTQTLLGHAVLWRGGDPEILPPPESVTGAGLEGLGINDAGIVVGRATPLYYQPFMWDPTTNTTTLLPYPEDALAGAIIGAEDVDDDGNVLVEYSNKGSTCSPVGDAALYKLPSGPYTYLDYGPDCSTGVVGRAIDGGTVIGWLSSSQGSFLWSGGVFTVGEQWNPADLAIDGNYAAGLADVGTGGRVPVRKVLGGSFEPLPLPDGASSAVVSAVNRLGWVVGHVTTPDGTHAYLWKTPTEGIDLGTLEGDVYSRATDVNDAGYIVGTSKSSAGSSYDNPVVWYVDPSAGTTPSADLQVTLTETSTGPYVTGDEVSYTAHVLNLGGDPVEATLTVTPEFIHQGSEWGTFDTGDGIINGVFSLPIGALAESESVEVPFTIVYDGFGTHGLSAAVDGDYDETNADDNSASLTTSVDLDLSAAGLQGGALDLPAAAISDGLPLTIFGLRVPASLIAGHPGPVFYPSALTPSTLVSVSGGGIDADDANFDASDGSDFRPRPKTLPASYAPAPDATIASLLVATQPEWLAGHVQFPMLDGASKHDRIIVLRGKTHLKVISAGDVPIGVDASETTDGLVVTGEGTGATDAQLAMCDATSFNVHAGGGDKADLLCGSLTTTVLEGDVSITLSDGTQVDVPAGATAYIEAAVGGGYTVNARTGTISVSSGGQTIEVPEGDDVHVPLITGELEGCGHGFWKNHDDPARFPAAWPLTGYAPDQRLEDENVFGVDVGSPDLTLEEALKARGGGMNALLREAVAALLNASHPHINYGMYGSEVISRFATAVSQGDYEATKNTFEELNQNSCPINGK